MPGTVYETKCRRCQHRLEHRIEEDPLEVFELRGTAGVLHCDKCNKLTIQDLVSFQLPVNFPRPGGEEQRSR